MNKGQLIVDLDPEPYQISVDRAAAAVAVAEAQVQQAQTQGRAIVAGIRAAYNNLKLAVDHVTEGIAKLKASLATREKTIAQRALAEIELRRAKNLLQSNSGTQQVVDRARPRIKLPRLPKSRPTSKSTWPGSGSSRRATSGSAAG